MGVVNFPPEEEPLGSIHVQIKGDDRVIDWLSPMTENGVPVEEIDLPEIGSQGIDSLATHFKEAFPREEDV